MNTLDKKLIGKYIDFTKPGKHEHSGIVVDIKHNQYEVTIVDDFDNEIEVLVSPEYITYVHEYE